MSLSASSEFDLEDLLYLEQTFYDAGYTDGHAHGRTHGLIEGRALGREKGYQLWEEVGFYEGFAKVWEAVCQTSDAVEHTTKNRTESHIRHLLDLVSQFPRVNPSAFPQGREDAEVAKLDVFELLSKIRARYKSLCAIVGVKPRLLAAGSSAVITEAVTEVPEVQGRNVWKLESKQGHTSPAEINF